MVSGAVTPAPAAFRLPDSTRLHGVHRGPLLAAERLPELIEILHRAIDSPVSGRVRVGQRQLPRHLLGLVLAPYLGEPKEITLCLCIAVNLVVDRLALR